MADATVNTLTTTATVSAADALCEDVSLYLNSLQYSHRGLSSPQLIKTNPRRTRRPTDGTDSAKSDELWEALNGTVKVNLLLSVLDTEGAIKPLKQIQEQTEMLIFMD